MQTVMMWAMLFMGLIWIIPVILVATSRRGNGTERAIWALVSVVISWLGYIAFLLSTRKTSH
ncbi:MAG: hypothetical protein Q8L45_01480 [Xanthomonadaceae bacterium]|jgi:TctA family transporter|nr:hypothetical protein [Xanthomonadaceae bacterium]MDP2185731.1 hypothetical protein [Xanthomonadales bacterium]MDZ4115014.1 hypothetical protein [Xanthomonadaceae bacterium]MDZ4378076.1 hypothetical protein [Xanthomonadaceae bacterium]PKM01260.1 MAG: hypothetical protein CVV16_15080 [Gammaproteobacteria bacterium HGW-Gammaproteobacteria-6]